MLYINNIMRYRKSLICFKHFKLAKSNQVDKEVIEYLSSKFENLNIKISRQLEGDIFSLMKKHLLEGWCWQTTESAIVFLNDDDFIERGHLTFEGDSYYPHSWICFTYKNEEYIFDPCLNLLCNKDLYHQIFTSDVVGKVNAKDVRNDLIYRMTEKANGEIPLNHLNSEIRVIGTEEINSPMYRNNTGYETIIEDNKIKKLVAHYYRKGR